MNHVHNEIRNMRYEIKQGQFWFYVDFKINLRLNKEGC